MLRPVRALFLGRIAGNAAERDKACDGRNGVLACRCGLLRPPCSRGHSSRVRSRAPSFKFSRCLWPGVLPPAHESPAAQLPVTQFPAKRSPAPKPHLAAAGVVVSNPLLPHRSPLPRGTLCLRRPRCLGQLATERSLQWALRLCFAHHLDEPGRWRACWLDERACRSATTTRRASPPSRAGRSHVLIPLRYVCQSPSVPPVVIETGIVVRSLLFHGRYG